VCSSAYLVMSCVAHAEPDAGRPSPRPIPQAENLPFQWKFIKAGVCASPGHPGCGRQCHGKGSLERKPLAAVQRSDGRRGLVSQVGGNLGALLVLNFKGSLRLTQGSVSYIDCMNTGLAGSLSLSLSARA
jgi:hypothetical protein